MDVRRMTRSATMWPRYLRNALHYARAGRGSKFPFAKGNLFPVLCDYHDAAGDVGAYFLQDLWAARRVYARRPERHIDIGSRIDGFVAHILTFMPVEVIDIRSLESNIPGLTFIQEDATNLNRFTDQSVVSISSLHAIEHFGLGRYGDPISPTACFDAMRSLARVLALGGQLYFSVPIGRQRVEFNAHRIFDPFTIIEQFGDLKLVDFAAVDDNNHLQEHANPEDFRQCSMACGLFEFTR
jgi:hypothetical protein